MHHQSVRLTKTQVDKFRAPTTGQAFLRDATLRGFALRVTANGIKSFIIEKRIQGQVKRITLGRYPDITVEQARKEAHKILGKIATGLNPIAEKEQARLVGVTLKQAFAEFLKARKSMKPYTAYNYRRMMERVFADWLPRPVIAITKKMVADRHTELGENSGPAYANGALRTLRAVLNFAQATYEDNSGRSILPENPVRRLTQTRAWYRVERRRTVIKPHQLPAWYQAVMDLKEGIFKEKPLLKEPPSFNENWLSFVKANALPEHTEPPYSPAHTVADYLLLLLFTGLRRTEAATLKWDNVDFLDRTLTIPDPKNREPFTLPLSDFVCELLTTRKAHAMNGYVFPGTGAYGYLIEPKRQIQHVIKASGVSFTLHDLRRTYITVAESLDISPYTIKRLVNHKMNGDVTAGYVVPGVERLRRSVQQISNYLLSTMGDGPSAAIHPFPSARQVSESHALLNATPATS